MRFKTLRRGVSLRICEESKKQKKAKEMQETKRSSIGDDVTCEDKEGNNSQQLQVRFVLPEGDMGQVDSIGTSKELLTQLPALPSICEFTIFTSNQVTAKSEKQVSKLPPVRNKCSKLAGNSQPSSAAQKKAKLENRSRESIMCAKQNLRIDTKCKLPEEYKEPTFKDTRRRIWEWLRQSEEQKPTYLRRANAQKKTIRLDTINTHIFDQQTASLT